MTNIPVAHVLVEIVRLGRRPHPSMGQSGRSLGMISASNGGSPTVSVT